MIPRIRGKFRWIFQHRAGRPSAYEASRDRVEDATLVLSVGDDVEAKFTGVDRKNRAISLSVRAKDEADEKDAIATVNKQEDANFSNNAMAEAFKAAKGE
ncbi:hypothetical protein KM92CIT3_70002 [uncultured Citrobacter sp.]|uniref:S1 motif domain-containing protein n=1 Tax=uncultured Citrobacter sp. TaxID=200446 RepID=A0A212IHV8_9ENTR|nr:hypothetical protein KM92CIT3_70002 [uncultured Citrobacter sp.]